MRLNLLVQTNHEWCITWSFLQPVPLADISDEQPSVSISQWHCVWLLCPSWTRVSLYPLRSAGCSAASLPPAGPRRAALQMLPRGWFGSVKQTGKELTITCKRRISGLGCVSVGRVVPLK